MLREATERAQGGAPGPDTPKPGVDPAAKTPVPEPPATPEEKITCQCGAVISVKIGEDEEQRHSCSHCNRKFQVNLIIDPLNGKKELFPMYIDEEDVSGTTLVAKALASDEGVVPDSDILPAQGESFGLTPAPSSQPAVPAEPEVPLQMSFFCFCGKRMLAKADHYETKVRCPACKTRLFLRPHFDPIKRAWALAPGRVEDPPTGDTRHLTAL